MLKRKRIKALLLPFFISIFIGNLLLISLIYKIKYNQQAELKIFNEIADHTGNTNKQFTGAAPFVLGASVQSNITVGDARSANLRYFFRKYNSPLYEYADDMVAISDKNNLDYRLLAAIAMQESNLCLKIPPDSHNCWGWGIYGDKVTRFDSYPEAMETVAEGLKKEYVDKGLITPETIMRKYTPPSTGSWANGVNHFLQQLQ